MLLKGNSLRALRRIRDEANESGKTRTAMRASAILSMHKPSFQVDWPTSKSVASGHNVSLARMNTWLKKYEVEGVKGILEGKRSGRPPKMTKKQRQWLREALKRKPSNLGFFAKRWDWKILDQLLKNKWSLTYHPGHLRKLLKRYRGYVQPKKKYKL